MEKMHKFYTYHHKIKATFKIMIYKIYTDKFSLIRSKIPLYVHVFSWYNSNNSPHQMHHSEPLYDILSHSNI